MVFVEGEAIIAKPMRVAEDVVMVWKGNTKLNVECFDISEFETTAYMFYHLKP